MIEVPRVWVVLVKRKRLAMTHKFLHISSRDSKANILPKTDFHVGNSHHFAAHIEQRTTRIAGIDGRIGLNVCAPVQLHGGHTDHTFREGSLQTKWVADRKDTLPCIKGIVSLHWSHRKRLAVRALQFDKGKVKRVADRLNLNIINIGSLQAAVCLTHPNGGAQ